MTRESHAKRSRRAHARETVRFAWSSSDGILQAREFLGGGQRGSLVLHDWYGLNASFDDLCDRIGELRNSAVQFDLLDGEPVRNLSQAGRLLTRIDLAATHDAIEKALESISELTSAPASLWGVGVGARIALAHAARRASSHALAAVVCVDPDVELPIYPAEHRAASEVTPPPTLIVATEEFGAGTDRLPVPPEFLEAPAVRVVRVRDARREFFGGSNIRNCKDGPAHVAWSAVVGFAEEVELSG